MLQKVDFEDDFQALEEDRSHLAAAFILLGTVQAALGLFLCSIRFNRVGRRGRRVAVAGDLSFGRQNPGSVAADSDRTRPPNGHQRGAGAIQVIEQRTMTRDNLIAIADKFQLFPDKRTLMSATELVELMKKNTKFAPVDLAAGLQATIARAWKIRRSFSPLDLNMRDRGHGSARRQRADDANPQRRSSRSNQPGHGHDKVFDARSSENPGG